MAIGYFEVGFPTKLDLNDVVTTDGAQLTFE